MNTIVTAEQINDLRARYLRGEPWTRDELRAAINSMVEQRLADTQKETPAKKTRGSTGPKLSLDDLL